jgi:hypothetical protein
MRRVSRVILLGAATSLIGCIVPPLFATRTQIITSADSTSVFGTQAELRLSDETIVLGWDNTPRTYIPRDRTDFPRTLRVARLKSDVYLFQAELDPHEGYVLIPVRISKTREATPLVCQVREAVAADFGVRLSAARENHLELRGDRAGIIGLLASTLPCTPLFRIDTFLPATTELVAAAAAPGASPTEGCKPCREGGCVQGAVIDEAGAVVPGATIRAEPRSGPTEARTEQSDDAGSFSSRAFPKGVTNL